MSTENNSAANPAATAEVPSNTRALGIEVDSFSLPETGSVDLHLPGKESAPVVEDETPVAAPDEAPTDLTADDNQALEGDEAADASTEQPIEYGDKLDVAAYQNEFDTNGKLSDATYDHISKLTGMERGDIDAIVSAMKDRQDRNVARWDNMMGGAENKQAVLEWARENYTDAQRASFNKVFDSNDVNAIDLAVKGMVADYREAGGTFKAQGSAIDPNAEPVYGNRQSVTGFASEADYRTEVRSQRYKKDPTYRASVQAKLRASSFFKKSG